MNTNTQPPTFAVGGDASLGKQAWGGVQPVTRNWYQAGVGG